MAETHETNYLVLADRAVPYLLARVRWPDVAQAVSAASPYWLDDPGLFDLPYDPSAVAVSFVQAASVAEGWGWRLHTEAAEDALSYIRRMPANWSDLSPSERRAWGIEFVGRGRAPTRGTLRPTAATSNLHEVANERRGDARVKLDGRAHIRCGNTTISAELVDFSRRGAGCVLTKASLLVTSGVTLAGPFLLEAEADKSRICLDVSSRIRWYRSTGAGTRFGVAFADLAMDESEGVEGVLAAAGRS